MPSGVTTRILQLEEEQGVQLFAGKKRLYPRTRRTLYGYARKILAMVDEAEKTASGAWSPAANSVSARWKARRLYACLKCCSAAAHGLPANRSGLVIGTNRSLL